MRLCDLVRGLSSSYDHLGLVYADQHGVYQTDFRALLLIDARTGDDTPINAGELAHALGLSSGAVTYLVERLAQSGHVQRKVDPRDRRKVLLACTEKGRDLVQGYYGPLSAAINESLADLDTAQVEQLQAVVSRLTGVMAARAAQVSAEVAQRAART